MFNETERLSRPLRWAMVGGGAGSQIGYSHRDAAQRDGMMVLVAGAFDIDHARGVQFGLALGLPADRCYADYKSMFASERARGDGIEVVSIATPNNSHYEICKAALEAGLHVVCEKPLALELTQALELQELAAKSNRVLGVMYGYAGYEMVHQARAMVQHGDLGTIRLIQMQFAHGYHAVAVEQNDAGTQWRVTPRVSGPTYVLGDIGTHCYQMGNFISGLRPDALSCMRSSFVASRAPLEDDAHVMLRYPGGAVGTLWASAINIGSAHGFKVRVVGSLGSVEWWDEQPNQLQVAFIGKPVMTYERGHGYLHPEARFERVGGGHPSGYFDSWANLYRRFAIAMSVDANAKVQPQLAGQWFPSATDGVDGVRFNICCARSADAQSQWVRLE